MFYPWRKVIVRLVKINFIQDCYCEGKPPPSHPCSHQWPHFGHQNSLCSWLYSVGCIEGPSARFLSALVENIILYSKRRFPLIALSAAIFFKSVLQATPKSWAERRSQDSRKWCHIHSHHRSHLKSEWGPSHSPYRQLEILPLLWKEWTAVDGSDLTHLWQLITAMEMTNCGVCSGLSLGRSQHMRSQ